MAPKTKRKSSNRKSQAVRGTKTEPLPKKTKIAVANEAKLKSSIETTPRVTATETQAKPSKPKSAEILSKIFDKYYPDEHVKSPSNSVRVASLQNSSKLALDSTDPTKAKILQKIFGKKKSQQSNEVKALVTEMDEMKLKDHPSWDMLFNILEPIPELPLFQMATHEKIQNWTQFNEKWEQMNRFSEESPL